MSKRPLHEDPGVQAICKVLGVDPKTVVELTVERPDVRWAMASLPADPTLHEVHLQAAIPKRPRVLHVTIKHKIGESFHVIRGRKLRELWRELGRAERVRRERERAERMAEHAHDAARESVALLEEIGKSLVDALGLDDRAEIELAGCVAKAKISLADLYAYIVKIGGNGDA